MFAQNGALKGVLTSNGIPLPYASCFIEELGKGVTSDEKGAFKLNDLPAGNYIMSVSSLGYMPVETEISIKSDDVQKLSLQLEEMPYNVNEIVVTGTRTDRRRLDNPVAVNVLDAKTFDITQSNTLSEGLCFQPGLRMETDCQTCNYTQLRMNGLGGAYSQILINSRPVFTSLMGMYSLEQLPASQIERVEVVRGGGSVLFGSNAIAGTVNIITKTPKTNSYSISNSLSAIDGVSLDNVFNANVTNVNDKGNAGISFFASNRNREEYDANEDGFSELPRLKNNTFGFKSFFSANDEHLLELNGWSIYEFRRGGNKMDLPADKTDQSEERTHNIWVGGVDYSYKPKGKPYSFQAYSSAQYTNRVHYTGIDQIDGWGNSESCTWVNGIQYNHRLSYWGGVNTITAGIDHQYDDTYDAIEAYGYMVDQTTNLTGAFLQSDWEPHPKYTVLSGIRLNKHGFVNKTIATPRLSLLYKPIQKLQVRASYASGFKAPQALETDMHIAFAGGGISRVVIDPSLKEETSNSFNLSFDFNDPKPKYIYGFTLDAFYTQLRDAFVLEENGTDLLGNQLLLRKNGGNAVVRGLTAEIRLNIDQKFQIEGGLTSQLYVFDEPIVWSENVEGTLTNLRSPNMYGFYTLSYQPKGGFSASVSGVYTGSMLVPHYAGAPGVLEDIVLVSRPFLETNFKLNYTLHLHEIEQDVKLSAGIQNVFNSYQSNFDTGRYRDSNFIYGPSRPRTFFIGITFGNFTNH